jgi:hypothetical protein
MKSDIMKAGRKRAEESIAESNGIYGQSICKTLIVSSTRLTSWYRDIHLQTMLARQGRRIAAAERRWNSTQLPTATGWLWAMRYENTLWLPETDAEA